jgi:Tfp pilus assembly protein PilN
MPAKDVRIKINLLPSEDLDKQPLNKFLKWVLTYGRTIIITTELIVIMAFLSRFVLDRELTDLHEAISQKRAIVEATVELESGFRNLQKRLENIKLISGTYNNMDKVLANLILIMPNDVYLTDFVLTKDNITLTAVSSTRAGFSIFINNLKRSKIFSNIKIGAIDEGVDKSPGIKFGLSMKVQIK